MLATPRATRPAPGASDSPATMPFHRDLAYAGRAAGGLWRFTAADGAAVAYHPADREAECDCATSARGAVCWHIRHVERAWLGEVCRRVAAAMADDELLHAGRFAAILADRPEPVMLEALRAEWRRRAEAARAGQAGEAA